jgi:hypothetical protein
MCQPPQFDALRFPVRLAELARKEKYCRGNPFEEPI